AIVKAEYTVYAHAYIAATAPSPKPQSDCNTKNLFVISVSSNDIISFYRLIIRNLWAFNNHCQTNVAGYKLSQVIGKLLRSNWRYMIFEQSFVTINTESINSL